MSSIESPKCPNDCGGECVHRHGDWWYCTTCTSWMMGSRLRAKGLLSKESVPVKDSKSKSKKSKKGEVVTPEVEGGEIKQTVKPTKTKTVKQSVVKSASNPTKPVKPAKPVKPSVSLLVGSIDSLMSIGVEEASLSKPLMSIGLDGPPGGRSRVGSRGFRRPRI